MGVELKNSTPTIIIKLNENMMISKDAKIETIIMANNDIGRPKIIARFLMFL